MSNSTSARTYTGIGCPTYFLTSTRCRFIEHFMKFNENVSVSFDPGVLFETLDIINTLLTTHFDRHGCGLTYLCSTQSWAHVPFTLEPSPSPLRIYQQLQLVAQTVSKAMRSDQIFLLLGALYGEIFQSVSSFNELHDDKEYLLRVFHNGVLNALTIEGTEYRQRIFKQINGFPAVGKPKQLVPAMTSVIDFVRNIVSMRMSLKMDFQLQSTYMNDFFGLHSFTCGNTQIKSNDIDIFVTFGVICALLECLDIVFDERLPSLGTVTDFATHAQCIDAGEEMLRPGGQKYCSRPGMRFIALFPAFVKKKYVGSQQILSNTDIFYTGRPKSVNATYQVANQNIFTQPLTPVYLARLAVFESGLANYDWSRKMRLNQCITSGFSSDLHGSGLFQQISINSTDRRQSSSSIANSDEGLNNAQQSKYQLSAKDSMRIAFYHQCEQKKKDKQNQTLYLIDEVEQLMRQGKSIWSKLQGKQQVISAKAKPQEQEEEQQYDETAVQETLVSPEHLTSISNQDKYSTYQQDIKSSYQIYLEQQDPQSTIKWTGNQLNAKYSSIKDQQ